jgi:CheY-like chemotaxis protein
MCNGGVQSPAAAICRIGTARAASYTAAEDPVDVLIVDDNELNTRALARLLGGCHRVRVATSAAQALAALRARRPDVVLCDFALGDETCCELLRVITRELPGVRRVLYSASRPELWRELIAERLIDASLAKPATREVLLAALAL